jgi:hypothetical protein
MPSSVVVTSSDILDRLIPRDFRRTADHRETLGADICQIKLLTR